MTRNPASRRGAGRSVSVATEPPRQLDIDGVEVDVAHALEELARLGVGQTLGQTVAPGLVLGLQGAELGHGRGPARRAGLRPGRRALRPLLDGDGRPAALPEPALAFGVREGHAAIVALR